MTTIKKLAEDLIRTCPNTPNLTLARRLYSENPELISSLEAARTAIRSVRGACGKRDLKYATKGLERKGVPYNPLKLPEPEEDDWKPFILDDLKKFGIINDIHLPYHDLTSLTLGLEYFKAQGLDGILLNGDLMDFYQASRFLKDPRKRNLANELDTCKQFFQALRSTFPKLRIIFKLGNHDERFEHYLLHKSPELLGIEALDLGNLIDVDKYGVEIVGGKRPIWSGDLTILHGHEFPQAMLSPVNVARGLFLRAKADAVQAHNHSTSEHCEPNVRGKVITTWSVGCMCQLNPEYARFNRWNHGLATVEMYKNDYELINKRIKDGRVK
jgi:hypothetical protein